MRSVEGGAESAIVTPQAAAATAAAAESVCTEDARTAARHGIEHIKSCS
jgi:hypothetical protein